MTRWELERLITLKALKDPAFKKRLISHPKETLREFCKHQEEKFFNHELFDRLNIKIHEEKKDEWTISLPYVPQNVQKLSDEELNKLFAAGKSNCIWFG